MINQRLTSPRPPNPLLQAPVARSCALGCTLDMSHSLCLWVVPREEGMMAEASKAVGAGCWLRCLGLCGLQVLMDQLEIHNAWDHRLFLEPNIPVAPWRLLRLLLRLGLCLWTEAGMVKERPVVFPLAHQASRTQVPIMKPSPKG